MPTITNIIPNINQSVFHWLNTASYTKGATTGTLINHYPNLRIMLGFPSALEALNLPTISLISEPILEQSEEVFSEWRKLITFPFL